MNEFLASISAAAEKLFRGPAFSSVLVRFGVDAKRYWLLLDLFDQLSKRGEMQGELGRQHHFLRVSTGYFLFFSGMGAVIALFTQARAWKFAGVVLALMTFTLVSTLLSEAANSLVNPEEALSLSHQPINGSTYTAAKLSHLLRVVVYSVFGCNLLPALVLPMLPEGHWFYPALDLILALVVGIFIALFCCSIYGLLMRVIPARRMKSASQFVQAIPLAIFGILRFSPQGTTRKLLTAAGSVAAPLAQIPIWLLATTSGTVGVALIVLGLRSLSADYLIRASAMVHGHSNATTRVRRSVLGEIVYYLFGGPGGRAGFDYMKRMILRDWQFRRRLLGFIPMLFGLSAGLLRSGWRSPFDPGFTGAHLLPHALGFILYMSCVLMAYGTDYKGTWLFLVVADRALVQFARGVHASLWLMFVVVPNVVLLPYCVWRWGLATALAFSVFSIAASSVYLVFGLRAIDGIPFGKQITPGRETSGQGAFSILLFIMLALIAVAIQYLIFRSPVVAAVATVALVVSALFMTRWAISTFTTAMRHHLGNLSQTSSMLYTEINMG